MATRTRKPATERRDEIVAAVLYIIGERGLTSLTTTTLAAEIGVTSGALFRHYPTLDDILLDVVRRAVIRIDETFPDDALPPLERLLTLGRNRIRLLGPEPGLAWLLRSEQAYLTLPDEAVDALRDVARRSREFLLNALRDGAANGSIRTDFPSEVLLVPVIGTIHTLIGTPGSSGIANRNAPQVLAALQQMIAASEGAAT